MQTHRSLSLLALAASAACIDGSHDPGGAAPFQLAEQGTGGLVTLQLSSPDHEVQGEISVEASGALAYAVRRGDTAIIERSRLGIRIGDADLGDGVEIGAPVWRVIDEEYATRGARSRARDHANAFEIPVLHRTSGTAWTLEVRAYEQGLAFRYVVPGEGAREVRGEATEWTIPEGSSIWYQTNTQSYEGLHRRSTPEAIVAGTSIGMPATIVLADGTYAALTEASLERYSGLTLAARGSRVLGAELADDPSGWTAEGLVRSPWRVVFTGPTLDALVGANLVEDLAAPPDPALFPEGQSAPWIRPGRSVWSWWSGTIGELGHVAFDRQHAWIDDAAALGFEYDLIDVGWENAWRDETRDEWDRLAELVEYARQRGVSLWIWKRWADGVTDGVVNEGIETEARRRAFLDRARAAGVAGVKIDFMDSESVERNAFYRDVLEDAAARELMINFHGANKPMGEGRTWPNEMTREGVMGLEYNKWSVVPPEHYATLPFTRYLAGPGDFTPVTFDPDMLKGTTVTLQLATAVLFTSPILHFADRPERYFQSPARELLESIPSTWDETRVLEGSEIGELAALARRSGRDWFVAVVNGSAAERSYALDLGFLGEGAYRAKLARDVPGDATRLSVEERGDLVRGGRVDVVLAPGGGFVARLEARGSP